MSLALIQGYSSAEEEENDRFSQNSSEEDDQNDVAYAPLSRPIGDKPSFHFPTASSGSALPSAFDAFSEVIFFQILYCYPFWMLRKWKKIENLNDCARSS